MPKDILAGKSDEYLQQLVDLNNKGNHEGAFDFAKMIEQHAYFENLPLSHSAQFYFQAALAASLVSAGRYHATISQWRDKARRCKDYSSEMEGDFIRDEILAACRTGKITTHVETLLERLGELHGTVRFSNRYAALVMTRGRVQYAKGNFGAALELFRHAEEIFHRLAWDGTGRVDEQWRRNNRFAMLRSAAHIAPKSATKIAQVILSDAGEQIERRKRLARLVQNISWSRPLGRLVITAYDLMERRASR